MLNLKIYVRIISKIIVQILDCLAFLFNGLGQVKIIV